MADFSSPGKSDDRQMAEESAAPPAQGSLYFAYGSNLDRATWSGFCRGHAVDPDVLRAIGPAVLEGELLVFDHRSARWQGGALNIRPAPEACVDGVLFDVDTDGWAALDLKEGHPRRYRREMVTVRDAKGGEHRAWTYRVQPGRRGGFTPPTEAYLEVCRAGRARFGLSNAQLDRAAAGYL